MTFPRLLDWRTLLIYSHRWLGIAGLLLFLAWFASGIVFMYVGMPALSADERLMRLSPLDLGSCSPPGGGCGVTPHRTRPVAAPPPGVGVRS